MLVITFHHSRPNEFMVINDMTFDLEVDIISRTYLKVPMNIYMDFILGTLKLTSGGTNRR